MTLLVQKMVRGARCWATQDSVVTNATLESGNESR